MLGFSCGVSLNFFDRWPGREQKTSNFALGTWEYQQSLCIYIYIYKQIYVWILYMNSPYICDIWKLSLYHNVWKLPFFFRNTRISWSNLGGFWWMALALEGWWLDQFSGILRQFLFVPLASWVAFFCLLMMLMFSEYVRLRGARWQTISICRSVS